jgi:uncharacterized membrane protein YheB (UPF0754 family)
LYVQLVDDSNRNKIVKAINDWISSKYEEFVKTEGYSRLKGDFANKLSEYLKSDDLKDKSSRLIESFINKLKEDNRSFSEIIPEDALNEIKVYVFNHSDDIAKALNDLMNSGPLRDKLKVAVSTMIEGTFGGFVSKLINPDSISEKIISAVQKYLSNPLNYNNIAAITNKALESMLQNKISEFAYSISDETKKSTADNLTGAIINYLDSEDKRIKLINEMEKAASSLNIYEILDTVIINTIGNEKVDEDSNNSLGDLVENITEAMENIRLSSLISSIDADTVKSISNILISAFGGFVKNKAGYIVELINIPEIVENEINGFDVEFAEKIIIDISKRELSAITWLGALLGGIMGLLTPLMQLLYK